VGEHSGDYLSKENFISRMDHQLFPKLVLNGDHSGCNGSTILHEDKLFLDGKIIKFRLGILAIIIL